MAKATAGLKIDIDSNSVARASRRSDGLAASTNKVSAGVTKMTKALAVVGAAALAATAAIIAMTARIAEQADEIGKNSTALGLTTDSYQELTLAMELTGSSMEAGASSFRRLAANALDAQQGLGTAMAVFSQIGVSATTATGQIRSMDDMLADIADAFQDMPDGAEKTARAMDLFGRSGARLIPLLNEGSEGIEAMRQEARDLGLVLTSNVIVASEAFNDNVTRMKTAVGGLARDMASELIPRLSEVSTQIIGVVRNLRRSDSASTSFATNGLDLMIVALRSASVMSIRLAQGLMFLQRTYLEVEDNAARTRNLPGFLVGLNDAHVENPAIARIDAAAANLEVMLGHVERVGRRTATSIGSHMATIQDEIAAAIRLAESAGDDLTPSGSSAAVETMDKFELAAKAAARHTLVIRREMEGARHTGNELRRIWSELGAENQQRREQELKLLEENVRIGEQKLADAMNSNKLAGAEKMAEALQRIEDRALSLRDVASQAMSGVLASFQSFSVAALINKDADALKNFGKSLGTMLVQLGTMAVAYAGVALLASAFPALIPLVGNPAAAPGLALAGAGALAAGAALGAATRSSAPSAAPAASAPTAGPTTTQNIYNVSFDSLTPARSRNRAMVESLSSSIGSAA